jgi:uncharacterized protein (DUF433 family)
VAVAAAPVGCGALGAYSSAVEHLPYKEVVAGSIPAAPTDVFAGQRAYGGSRGHAVRHTCDSPDVCGPAAPQHGGPSPGRRAYTECMSESRVVADHRVMGGVPCIRGTRIPVATLVGLVAQGQSVEEILADYPQLSAEDVRAALEFAAAAMSERQVPLRAPA